MSNPLIEKILVNIITQIGFRSLEEKKKFFFSEQISGYNFYLFTISDFRVNYTKSSYWTGHGTETILELYNQCDISGLVLYLVLPPRVDLLNYLFSTPPPFFGNTDYL